MKLVQLAPVPGEAELSSFEALREHFTTRHWTAPSFLLNIVADAEGRFTGATGSSRDVSNEYDYQSLIGYRMIADVILTTAATARAEGYRRSKFAPLALVSRSADFSGVPAVEEDSAGPTDSPVVLLVRRGQVRKTRARYSKPWVNVYSIGSGSAFGLSFRLTRLGFRRILVEAGPRYANWLLANSVIRGVALTVVGSTATSPLEAARPALDGLGVSAAVLESAEQIANTLFTRWVDISANHLG